MLKQIGISVAAALVVFFGAHACKTTGSDDSGVLQTERMPIVNFNYNEMFELARLMLTQPVVVEFQRNLYREFLTVTGATSPLFRSLGNGSAIKDLSEHQYIALMQTEPNLVNNIKSFLCAQLGKDFRQVPEAMRKQPGFGCYGPRTVPTNRAPTNRQNHAQTARQALDRGDFRARFLAQNDILNAYRLQTPRDGAAFRRIPGFGTRTTGGAGVDLFVGHETVVNGRTLPPDTVPGLDSAFLQAVGINPGQKMGLAGVWLKFIRGAEKEFVFNVFDFDYLPIARALVFMAQRGVNVRVGIDKRTAIDLNRESNKAVVRTLCGRPMNEPGFCENGNLMLTIVNSTGLNHQKLASRDWSIPGKGAVVFSSGNMTHSGIDMCGDARANPNTGQCNQAIDMRTRRPVRSVPNANHSVVFQSDIAAALVNHELSKSVGPRFRLRGSQFPLGGAYSLKGPQGTSMTISFTPGGGLQHVNELFLSRAIRERPGPVRLVQFAYSSPAVTQAILDRAARARQQGRTFDFLATGDTANTQAQWSQFLVLNDLTRRMPARLIANLMNMTDPSSVAALQQILDAKNLQGRSTAQVIRGSSLPENVVGQVLALNRVSTKVFFHRFPGPRGGPRFSMGAHGMVGRSQFRQFQERICTAPTEYGVRDAMVGNREMEISAKVHHKLVVIGDVSSVGTSFNFSNSAEKNSEQVLFITDKKIAARATGIAGFLMHRSPTSVLGEAMRRTNRNLFRGSYLVASVRANNPLCAHPQFVRRMVREEVDGEMQEVPRCQFRMKRDELMFFGVLTGDSKAKGCLGRPGI